MADCSYARCIQERRFIKRELQKWTKNMVYIVGLERVAEELMGRRKWKQYQDLIQRSNINVDATNLTQKTSPVVNNGHHHHTHQQDENLSFQKTDIDTDPTNHHLKDKVVIENNNKSVEELEKSLKKEEETTTTESIKTEPEKTLVNKSETTESNLNAEDIKAEPVDWKPQDKCYFCVDGKLLTVNETGELVAESGPVQTEADLTNIRLHDSDSDSSESEQDQKRSLAAINKNLAAAFLRQAQQGLQPNMTSFESMAAQLAVAQLHGLQPGLAPFYPGFLYGMQSQLQSQQPPQQSPQYQTTASLNQQSPSQSMSPSLAEPNTSNSPVTKSTLPDLIAVGSEQPLDLSAKPSGSSIRDPPPIFKAKPRLPPMPGRRSYTEEELQNALRDILSGKLGTRRAAVIYGIPRSTLRNKVYKYTMENRQIPDDDDDDKDDDVVDDLAPTSTPPLSTEELLRMSSQAAFQRLILDSQKTEVSSQDPPKIPTPQAPPVISPLLDPSLLLQLQGLLLAGGGLAGLPSLLSTKPDELAALQKLMLTQQELLKEQLKTIQSPQTLPTPEQNNGQDVRLLQNFIQQQQQQQQQPLFQKQSRTTSTPDTIKSGGDISEGTDESMLLRIPSYKPGPVPGSSSSKNGENIASASSTPPALRPVELHSPHNNHHLPVTSTPVIRPRSESQSPPSLLPGHKSMLSLSEVIAKSISKNFQQQVEQHSKQHHHPASGLDLMEQYKRPSISVIKNLGSVERFGQSSSLGAGSNTGTGGKGTRPKRGKYRNYDRDSLVEAVKAVQRGEMSVHRAGSYYGVPHSTLEYKVKERHLMRPRKREPKPQPLDGTSSSATTSANKTQDLSVSALRNQIDKSKLMPTIKQEKQPQFPATSPNGMKMPHMFDSAMAAQLQYPAFMWPHHPNFAGLPMQDFARNNPSGSNTQSSTSTTPTFPPNAEHLFAQHMMQRFQEDVNNRNGGGGSGANSGTKTPNSSNSSTSSSTVGTKTARELVESIYDTSTNGSFLDGIIRHSLDKKPAEMNHGALFDQLVKNNRVNPTVDHAEHGQPNAAMMAALVAQSGGKKRPGSPVNFAQTEIKKERASPASSIETDKETGDLTKETVENLIKLREGLAIKMEGQNSGVKEDINGGDTTSNDDENIQNEDSS